MISDILTQTYSLAHVLMNFVVCLLDIVGKV